MNRPLPGMDPWIEHPALWPGVHQRLITYASDSLAEQVGERYVVEMGERIFLETPDRNLYPDVTVVERAGPSGEGPEMQRSVDTPQVIVLDEVERREVFIEIRDAHRGEAVVTAIEILSPSNKRPGAGRELYLRKQAELLDSPAHLVEVDLLRGGQATVAVPEAVQAQHSYRVVVSRAGDRARRELYGFDLTDPLPRVGVPLLEPDPDVVLALPELLSKVYARGGYGRRLDYENQPVPPLTSDQWEWARQQLRGP